MKTVKFDKLDSLYNAYWKLRLRPFFSPKTGEASPLRLVLGIGRSGTTWIVNTLARAKQPMVCFEEPLFHLRPKIRPLGGKDHTSTDLVDKEHRIVKAYELLASPKINNLLTGRYVTRHDAAPAAVLVKEVHALFACLPVVQQTKAPTIFIIREIPTILDSLFNAQGIESTYLRDEYNMLSNSLFLHTYFRKQEKELREIINRIEGDNDTRNKQILSIALVMYLIQKSFEHISSICENAKTVSYEEIVANPDHHFKTISDFFSFPYSQGDFNFKNTVDKDENCNYSIARESKKLVNRKRKFLTDDDFSIISKFLGMVENISN